MEEGNLNNLNTLPLNITCESLTSPSEDDNNVEMSENLDNKALKPSEDKQNFRELLQDRVLRRLQEKAEYGKRNVSSRDSTLCEKEEAKSPALKRIFSNEDLWKRVEGRVAAKKATNDNLVSVTGMDKVTNSPTVKGSGSSEDIKSRIRTMSKAIGLASTIQSQIKTETEKENTAPRLQASRKISSSSNHLDTTQVL